MKCTPKHSPSNQHRKVKCELITKEEQSENCRFAIKLPLRRPSILINPSISSGNGTDFAQYGQHTE